MQRWIDSLNKYIIKELGNGYTVIKQIGKGSYSNVFKIIKTDKGGDVFALKVIKK